MVKRPALETHLGLALWADSWFVQVRRLMDRGFAARTRAPLEGWVGVYLIGPLEAKVFLIELGTHDLL